MKNNELGTIRQKLIKELLKELKEPKDFWDLMQELKNALIDKVNKAFEGEELNEWNLYSIKLKMPVLRFENCH